MHQKSSTVLYVDRYLRFQLPDVAGVVWGCCVSVASVVDDDVAVVAAAAAVDSSDSLVRFILRA